MTFTEFVFIYSLILRHTHVNKNDLHKKTKNINVLIIYRVVYNYFDTLDGHKDVVNIKNKKD